MSSNIKSKRTSKRCSRGSRKDKKTQVCVQYAKVKTFTDIKDQNISETDTTLSVEGLGEKNKDGAIIKLYHKGDLRSQEYISSEKIKKAQYKTTDQVKKSKDVMKKIMKNPNLMLKDKKFRQFQKKIDDAYKTTKSKRKNKTMNKAMKGGGDTSDPIELEIVTQTEINIDSSLIPKNENPNIESDNWWSNIMAMNLLQSGVSTDALLQGANIIDTYKRFNYCKYIQCGPKGEGALYLHGTATATANAGAILNIEIYGSLFMALLNTLPIFFPGVEELETLVTIAQYIYYIVFIPLNIFTLGWGWGIALSIIPAINLFYMTFGNKSPPDTYITEEKDDSLSLV